MKVIKIPSNYGRPKSYNGLKVIFDDGTVIHFSAIQLMPFLRFDYREDQNLAKYAINMLNEIRLAFNKPPLKYKTYEYFK